MELSEEQTDAVADDEPAVDAYSGLCADPFAVALHPAPSSGSPGSPTSGGHLERCHAYRHSHGVVAEGGAGAPGPWGTAAAWGPWQSFV